MALLIIALNEIMVLTWQQLQVQKGEHELQSCSLWLWLVELVLFVNK